MIAQQPGRTRECSGAFCADVHHGLWARHNLDCSAVLEHQAVIVTQVKPSRQHQFDYSSSQAGDGPAWHPALVVVQQQDVANLKITAVADRYCSGHHIRVRCEYEN